jgi:hypothetical protein
MADFQFPVPPIISSTYAPIAGFAGGPSYYVPTDQVKLAARPPGWQEIPEGYGEGSDERGSWTTRTYIGPWSQRKLFRLWLRGTAWRDAGGNIKRIVPAQDPCDPWQYCQEERIIGGKGAWVNDPNVFPIVNNSGASGLYSLSTGGGGGASLSTGGGLLSVGSIPQVMAFVNNDQSGNTAFLDSLGNVQLPTGLFDDGMAVIRATFRSVDYQVLNDRDAANSGYTPVELCRFVRRHWKPSVEAIPLANIASAGGLIFVGTPEARPPMGIIGQRIFEAGVRMLPVAQVEWAWLDVPDPPLTMIDALIGKINSVQFDAVGSDLGYGSYQPYTLLFGQPDYHEKPRDVCGQKLWDIKCRAMYRPQGWNSFLASDGNFYLCRFSKAPSPSVSGEPDSNLVYKFGDFNSIFGASPAIPWNPNPS